MLIVNVCYLLKELFDFPNYIFAILQSKIPSFFTMFIFFFFFVLFTKQFLFRRGNFIEERVWINNIYLRRISFIFFWYEHFFIRENLLLEFFYIIFKRKIQNMYKIYKINYLPFTLTRLFFSNPIFPSLFTTTKYKNNILQFSFIITSTGNPFFSLIYNKLLHRKKRTTWL